MSDKDKVIPFDQVNKRDLEVILEVNKKAVEIETEVADQNEEIIRLLKSGEESQKKADEKLDKTDEKLDKIIKQGEDTSRDIFTMRILFIVGLLGLIGQIVSILYKK
jgi:hypothetical protein